MKTLVVNFFGGPGTGKSTVTAHAFALLKWAGYNVEIASEYAKDKVWEKSQHVLTNQIYIFAKQYKRIKQLEGQVDVVLTDGPLLHTLFYSEDEVLRNLAQQSHDSFNNFNVFLVRRKAYNPSGRTQTEDEARAIDTSIQRMLDLAGQQYTEVEALEENVPKLVDRITQVLT